MNADSESTRGQLGTLAQHLSDAQEDILDAWRVAAERDALLATSSHLTRNQFNNHIPRIIHALCSRLRLWPDDDTPEQRQLELEAVKTHSHHRWQVGYNMRAVVRDWGHVNICVLQELDNFGRRNADAQVDVLPEARQIWANLVNDCIAQSAVEYHALLQVESTARLQEMETVLEHMRELEVVRGHDLRTVTHDLRGSLGILMGTTSLIGDAQVCQDDRTKMCRLLTQGVSALHQMLEELMDMARLEAAQDPLHIAPFDVGQVLTELCMTSQSLAEAKGLFLKADGRDHFLAEGDLVKTRRIAQNLLLNALKYTKAGGVSVSWKEHGGDQWLLCVQDTGPGLESGAGDSHDQPQGEGVGLSIVKRLCELLDTRIEVDSRTAVGTTFKVFFPTHPHGKGVTAIQQTNDPGRN